MKKKPKKNPAAVALGKLRGATMTNEERSAGGKASQAKLTKEERVRRGKKGAASIPQAKRVESARNAIASRWAKERERKAAMLASAKRIVAYVDQLEHVDPEWQDAADLANEFIAKGSK